MATPETQGPNIPEADLNELRPVPTWNADEQLASQEKREKFTAYAREVFARFENGIKKDRPEYGAMPRWRAFYEECAQRIQNYAKATPNQDTPTTPEGMQLMLESVTGLDAALRQYDKERASFGRPTEETRRKETVQETDDPNRDWRKEAGDVFARQKALIAELGDPMKENQLCKDYLAKDAEYYEIYKKYAFPQVSDEKMCASVVGEMKRLLDAYEPVLRKASKPEDKKGSLFAIDFNMSALQDGIAENATAKDLYLKMQFGGMDSSPTKNIDVREKIINLSQAQTFQRLTPEQLEAVLFMKAHLPDVSGADKRFNRSDVRPVAEALRADQLSKARGLYEKIVEESMASADPKERIDTEEKKMGLRLMIDEINGITYQTLRNGTANRANMLATEAEHAKKYNGLQKLAAAPGQIAQGQQKLNKGIRIVNLLTPLRRRRFSAMQPVPLRPLRNMISGKVAEGAGKLAAGKAEYAQGLALKRQYETTKYGLPGRILDSIEAKIHAGLDSANVGPIDAVDTTRRTGITEDFMRKFEKHLAVLDAIGGGDLDSISANSGLKVTSAATNGLGQEIPRWMLDAQNAPEGKKGIPPGTILWVEPGIAGEKVAEAQE